ncbi:Nramp family divalent metal transporter [Convivina praedatoris]|uniref:Divalent metal cation transporter MntH n=1 Tax=Convivina praedatoris TaxID=2880963 RepID=A0ABN8H8I3_9LACO|nr:Nramp family divalent metal transporter [Convivina sp. LMG 32447]CAH1852236.1 Divalent metal cation transporter MntH [Convivina sp. LMG 32447]CAH1852270.1 Divalent metal cation transporter MntH [Convivina sp. LMG 32447]CAH1852679.1 Divalent metal cation transporter MntH [Convivina sp. LMG 32447]
MDNSTQGSPRKKHSLIEHTGEKSLEEVNGTIEIPKNGSFWRRLLAFSGPGALVAVGYMDPGNWVTSVAGGAGYRYLLLSIVLISSLIAMLLQYMAGKLGIVKQEDLAQATGSRTNRFGRYTLWVFTELALMATDIAEVIGGAIALHLLFGWPMIVTVLLTAFDVVLLLLLMKFGFRKIEAIVATLILTILVVYVYLVALSHPDWLGVLAGYVPQPHVLSTHEVSGLDSPLTLTAGIIGATVMPHNLYLHSSISQTRKVNHEDHEEVRDAVRLMTWDSNIQLTLAFVINSLLLILGAALFYGHGADLGSFGAMYRALQDNSIAGAIASPVLSTLFAVALLASGQNSTITGTLTGEIVMEGFLHLRIPMWLRRVVTRGLALLPVVAATIYYGGNEAELDKLLTNSQVFLSIVLPFSMAPLIYFTSSKKIMGEFANPKWVTWLGWICFTVLTIINIWIVYNSVTDIFGLK